MIDLRRIIEENEKEAASAKETEKILASVIKTCSDICNSTFGELSGFSVTNGSQVALSAAFEILSKATETHGDSGFTDFDLALKNMLVSGYRVEQSEDDNE